MTIATALRHGAKARERRRAYAAAVLEAENRRLAELPPAHLVVTIKSHVFDDCESVHSRAFIVKLIRICNRISAFGNIGVVTQRPEWVYDQLAGHVRIAIPVRQDIARSARIDRVRADPAVVSADWA